ncbi:hypothetical protein NDU88_005532 [Pleurodeles waltl]|uniref:Uncharacterized protein n=1 Tax=Pleurodeles waltl TaxID=8319 RepID=A0AAV7RJD4_PLEWA|nr:hypothetical protein NDU88_005532 [Pleurodeles waltl]
MCRLTSKQDSLCRAAGTVYWHLAALELRKTRLAVARFPLRGRTSSGGSRRSGRVSTSNRLTLPATQEDTWSASTPWT